MGEERGIGTAGGGRWTFEGVAYPTRSGMCRARRERYVALLDEGLNFTQAARMVVFCFNVCSTGSAVFFRSVG